jgi:hypothetical protein
MDSDILRAKQKAHEFAESLTSLTCEERIVAEKLADEIISVLADEYGVGEKIQSGLIRGRVVTSALAIATKYATELEHPT